MNIEIKQLSLQNLQISENEERTFIGIASAEVSDGEGDVVLIDGISTRFYELNPVVLANHDNSTDSIIGKAVDWKREGNIFKVKIALSNAPLAIDCWEKIKKGELKGLSMGFIPKEIRKPTPKDRERFGDDVYKVISKCELREISLVPVPSNQVALVLETSEKALDLQKTPPTPKVITVTWDSHKEILEKTKNEILKKKYNIK